MKSIPVAAVVLALCIAAAPARAELFACVGPDGKKSFTSDPQNPNCKLQPSYEPGATPPPPPAPKPAAVPAVAPAPKPAPRKIIIPKAEPRKAAIPKVAPKTQADRDILRRQILVHEHNREIKTRETLLQNISRAKTKLVRDHFQRLVRIHELNILAIRREIDLLGGNSARN